MAFVYKPVVTRTVNGCKRRRRTRYFWAQYVDTDGREVRRVLRLPNGSKVTDRRVAEAELRNLTRRIERKAVGLIDPSVESAAVPARTVLAGFARYLRGLRRSRIHVFKTLRRVKWLFEHADIKRLADVNESNASKALRLLSSRNRAPKTINDYRAALFGMCQWALKVERLIDRNPLESVPVQDVNGDVRKVRRALTPDEASGLLAAAGPRALWYETALYTGLRVGEQGALQWRDIDADGGRPVIRLRAATTKARRADCVPLRAELAAKLLVAKPTLAGPTARVFSTTPTLATFRRDCDRAGIRWQADERGRTLDRHSLRTTFVTWLSMAGVHPRTAQELARHTDIALTMQSYTDPKLIDTAAAVERLPALPRTAKLRKTGTTDGDGVVSGVVLPVVLNAQERPRTAGTADGAEPPQPLACSQVDTKVRGDAKGGETGGGGNRTPVPKHFNLGVYVCSRSICV